MSRGFIRPPRLKKGDTVGIISPSSPPNLEQLDRSLAFLETLGLKWKMGQAVRNKNRYLAGTDDERLSDLHAMFEDPEVKGIICAGGGYGSARYLDRIDYPMIRENPKIFWGYSDITALHTAISQYSDLVTFHGPMLASDVGKPDFHPLSARMFGQLFEPVELHYDETVSPLVSLSGGSALGPLSGGNLSLISASLGTKFAPVFDGVVLLIEDVDEPPYKVDAMLNQLRLSGALSRVAGVAIGDFRYPKDHKGDHTYEDVFDGFFRDFDKPVVSGFKIGHCQPHFAVPLGTQALLDADARTLTVLPGIE
ncbi:S66 peptidase family protein [Edaphobacillus lindanitolerans]|uniref:Muramoyltetrapeptide carboxypeptidase n=1 Tax=Edaphobacillus lindanitolerans TaxID=550447 RepID=A0A1U7PR99_9BACI|nr:LD-carboxypeptidase [Edaphobacillus lindanitolerans]SIT87186.1 muramoyltetrapeptide carboxypeptidase [Edaphobacillus lindanitolerans]